MTSRILVLGGGCFGVLLLAKALSGNGVVVSPMRELFPLRMREWTIEDLREAEDLYPGMDADQMVVVGRAKEHSDPAQDHGSCQPGDCTEPT